MQIIVTDAVEDYETVAGVVKLLVAWLLLRII